MTSIADLYGGPFMQMSPAQIRDTVLSRAASQAQQRRASEYEAWKSTHGLAEDPTYDLRAAFDAGLQPDERGHLSDTFKRPSHPTFSTESRYSTPKQRGGEWVPIGDESSGKWVFKASPHNMKNMSRELLMDYFDRVEPGNTIQFPDGSQYVGGVK